MTNHPSAIAKARRTRRQLLFGGTGALAAVMAAEAIARPAPAFAGVDGDVVLGQLNDETSTTVITNSTVNEDVLQCHGAGASTAVWGTSSSGIGIHGTSSSLYGVAGDGTTATSVGVIGTSADGFGVVGGSSNGTGVRAEGKIALRVDGPAVFSRSGTLVIPAGHTSAIQTGLQLNRPSIVLVTPQNDVTGVVVRSAVPDPAAGSFTVHLAKPVNKNVTVGWFVVN